MRKNPIFTSSVVSINDVLLHRAFRIGLKKVQVLSDRGGVFCFKWKTMSYSSCTQFVAFAIFFPLCTNWRTMKSLGKRALVIQFLSHGSNLCRGSASATPEIRWEQMCTVCDRKALDFYFCAWLGYLRQHLQFDCERRSCVLGSLVLTWHIQQWALLEHRQAWGCAHTVVGQSWAVITLKPFSGFPEWEEGRHGETCLPSDSKIIW